MPKITNGTGSYWHKELKPSSNNSSGAKNIECIFTAFTSPAHSSVKEKSCAFWEPILKVNQSVRKKVDRFKEDYKAVIAVLREKNWDELKKERKEKMTVVFLPEEKVSMEKFRSKFISLAQECYNDVHKNLKLPEIEWPNTGTRGYNSDQDIQMKRADNKPLTATDAAKIKDIRDSFHTYMLSGSFDDQFDGVHFTPHPAKAAEVMYLDAIEKGGGLMPSVYVTIEDKMAILQAYDALKEKPGCFEKWCKMKLEIYKEKNIKFNVGQYKEMINDMVQMREKLETISFVEMLARNEVDLDPDANNENYSSRLEVYRKKFTKMKLVELETISFVEMLARNEVDLDPDANNENYSSKLEVSRKKFTKMKLVELKGKKSEVKKDFAKKYADACSLCRRPVHYLIASKSDELEQKIIQSYASGHTVLSDEQSLDEKTKKLMYLCILQSELPEPTMSPSEGLVTLFLGWPESQQVMRDIENSLDKCAEKIKKNPLHSHLSNTETDQSKLSKLVHSSILSADLSYSKKNVCSGGKLEAPTAHMHLFAANQQLSQLAHDVPNYYAESKEVSIDEIVKGGKYAKRITGNLEMALLRILEMPDLNMRRLERLRKISPLLEFVTGLGKTSYQLERLKRQFTLTRAAADQMIYSAWDIKRTITEEDKNFLKKVFDDFDEQWNVSSVGTKRRSEYEPVAFTEEKYQWLLDRFKESSIGDLLGKGKESIEKILKAYAGYDRNLDPEVFQSAEVSPKEAMKSHEGVNKIFEDSKEKTIKSLGLDCKENRLGFIKQLTEAEARVRSLFVELELLRLPTKNDNIETSFAGTLNDCIGDKKQS